MKNNAECSGCCLILCGRTVTPAPTLSMMGGHASGRDAGDAERWWLGFLAPLSEPCHGSPSRRRRRAVIIGGSMSGLFSAAFLRRIGWDVDVFERSPVELVGRGAGITTHPGTAGGAGAKRRRHPRSRHRGRPSASPSTGTGASSASARCGRSSPPGTGCSGCCARPSIPRTTISATPSSASSRTSTGSACISREGRIERADLLVGGDGIRSGVRAQVAPQVQPIYSGYYIWRGAPNEADLAPDDAREHLSLFRVLPARAPAGHRLSDLGLQQRSAARPPPLQFHLVSRRRRADAQGDVRRRERPAA